MIRWLRRLFATPVLTTNPDPRCFREGSLERQVAILRGKV